MKWFTNDFKHPETGGLCRFCWNDADETIQMQPSPNELRNGFSSVWEISKAACAKWGIHSCGSMHEAERFINSSFPEVWKHWADGSEKIWTAQK